MSRTLFKEICTVHVIILRKGFKLCCKVYVLFIFILGVKMTSGGGGNSSLVVPMVMWGPQAPTHCISAIYLMRDQKTLLTGASDGQVILWEVDITTPKSSGNFYLNHILTFKTMTKDWIWKNIPSN